MQLNLICENKFVELKIDVTYDTYFHGTCRIAIDK